MPAIWPAAWPWEGLVGKGRGERADLSFNTENKNSGVKVDFEEAEKSDTKKERKSEFQETCIFVLKSQMSV